MPIVVNLLFGLGVALAGGGAVIAIAQAPDIVKILLTFRGKPARLSDAAAGRVHVQGVIRATGAPLPSFDDGRDLVYRFLMVTETHGRNNRQHYSGTAWAPFAIDDGTGSIDVEGDRGGVMSADRRMTRTNPAVDAFIGDPKYRWEGSRRFIVERGLAPGDFVSVRGAIVVRHDGPDGAPRRVLTRTDATGLWIVRGEPRLLATFEGRLLACGAIAIPVGAALIAAGWLLEAVALGSSP